MMTKKKEKIEVEERSGAHHILSKNKKMAAAFRDAVPQSARFAISGALGSVAFYVLNEIIVTNNPYNYQPITVAFFFAYLVSIWIQHALHSTLVFGWVKPYWTGLFSTYTGYSLALFASTPLNMFLVNYIHLNAGQAWLGSLIVTGIGNYFLLSWLNSEKKEKK